MSDIFRRTCDSIYHGRRRFGGGVGEGKKGVELGGAKIGGMTTYEIGGLDIERELLLLQILVMKSATAHRIKICIYMYMRGLGGGSACRVGKDNRKQQGMHIYM